MTRVPPPRTDPVPGLRAATAHDAEALAEIHAAAFGPDAWSEVVFAAQFAIPGVFGLLHAADGLVLARVAADESEILTLGVVPSARGRGIGADLLRRAGEIAATRPRAGSMRGRGSRRWGGGPATTPTSRMRWCCGRRSRRSSGARRVPGARGPGGAARADRGRGAIPGSTAGRWIVGRLVIVRGRACVRRGWKRWYRSAPRSGGSGPAAETEQDGSIRFRLDPQHLMALLLGGTGHVAHRLLTPEPDQEDLAGSHGVQSKSRPDEGHRADLPGNVNGTVHGLCLYHDTVLVLYT